MSDKYAILDRCLRDYGDHDKFVADLAVSQPALVLRVAEAAASNQGDRIVIVPEDSHVAVHDSGQTVLLMPPENALILWDGHEALLVNQRFDGEGMNMKPIARAVSVAWLRATADLLEGGEL